MLFWRWFRRIIVCFPLTSCFIYAYTACLGYFSFRGGAKKPLSDDNEESQQKACQTSSNIWWLSV